MYGKTFYLKREIYHSFFVKVYLNKFQVINLKFIEVKLFNDYSI